MSCSTLLSPLFSRLQHCLSSTFLYHFLYTKAGQLHLTIYSRFQSTTYDNHTLSPLLYSELRQFHFKIWTWPRERGHIYTPHVDMDGISRSPQPGEAGVIIKVIPSFFLTLESPMALSLSLAFYPIRIYAVCFSSFSFLIIEKIGCLRSPVLGRSSGAKYSRGYRRFSFSGLRDCCWKGGEGVKGGGVG